MTYEPPAPEAWDEALHAKPGSVFVTPDEFRDAVRRHRVRGLIKLALVEALAEAADADGVLADFDQEEFFTAHVARELADTDAGEQAAAVSYDRFTAMAMMDYLSSLAVDDGLLANRGKGDSHDYRLTLPPDMRRD